MGIQHIDDLAFQDLMQVLDQSWLAQEKVDGSFFAFGLNTEGKFYSRNKYHGPFESCDQWPNESWTLGFKQAHQVAAQYVEDLALVAPVEIQAEIIVYKNSNVLTYHTGCQIRIFYSSRSLPKKSNGNPVHVMVLHGQTWSLYQQNWIPVDQQLIQKPFQKSLTSWSEQPCGLLDLTIQQLLNLKLNQKPKDFVGCWVTGKQQLKQRRQELQHQLRDKLRDFKITLMDSLTSLTPLSLQSDNQEGWVIQTDTQMFKIVDGSAFKAANLFCHRVKYGLVGGRRPRKTSFLSRTALWSKENRLLRLNVLLQRYIDHHDRLHAQVVMNGKPLLLSYTGDLHHRTLGLFSDIKSRIENGW